MNNEILQEMNKRNVTRICHFTKSKNIPQILNNLGGILATDKIPDYYTDANDISRIDGKNDYICCSVEYPNVYYLNRIKDNDKLFNEWVILGIDPKVIINSNVLFSKVNAATERGKYIKQGIEGFKSLYKNEIITSKRTIYRSEKLYEACPTDIQAEIMVFEEINSKYIKEIIVPSKEQARSERVRMSALGIGENIKIKICKELFKKDLGNRLNKGYIPKEIEYNGE